MNYYLLSGLKQERKHTQHKTKTKKESIESIWLDGWTIARISVNISTRNGNLKGIITSSAKRENNLLPSNS